MVDQSQVSAHTITLLATNFLRALLSSMIFLSPVWWDVFCVVPWRVVSKIRPWASWPFWNSKRITPENGDWESDPAPFWLFAWVFSGANWLLVSVSGRVFPLKINVEPKNQPIEKEHNLPNLNFWIPTSFSRVYMTCCNSKFSTTPLQRYSEYFTVFHHNCSMKKQRGHWKVTQIWIHEFWWPQSSCSKSLSSLSCRSKANWPWLVRQKFWTSSPTSQAPPVLPISVFCFHLDSSEKQIWQFLSIFVQLFQFFDLGVQYIYKHSHHNAIHPFIISASKKLVRGVAAPRQRTRNDFAWFGVSRIASPGGPEVSESAGHGLFSCWWFQPIYCSKC